MDFARQSVPPILEASRLREGECGADHTPPRRNDRYPERHRPDHRGGAAGDGITTLAEAREEAASWSAGTSTAGSPSDGAAGDGITTLAGAREQAAAAANGTAAAGSAAAGALRQVISAPVTVARDVADDVASTLRRPDAVLYLGGVVGLAVLGVLEWPVVAVAGVGLAIANGRRRTRS